MAETKHIHIRWDALRSPMRWVVQVNGQWRDAPSSRAAQAGQYDLPRRELEELARHTYAMHAMVGRREVAQMWVIAERDGSAHPA